METSPFAARVFEGSGCGGELTQQEYEEQRRQLTAHCERSNDMAQLIDFVNGTWGRLARVALGLALIAYGLAVLGDTTGFGLAGIGLVPLGLGLWGHCLVEPLAGRQPRTS